MSAFSVKIEAHTTPRSTTSLFLPRYVSAIRHMIKQASLFLSRRLTGGMAKLSSGQWALV